MSRVAGTEGLIKSPMFYPEQTKENRKTLRKNMTEEERILWSTLKKYFPQYKFRKQAGIGKFIADFYCTEKKLIIELDGAQHLENAEYDSQREDFMNSLGLTTIRFWNEDIRKNLNGVLMEIEHLLMK